jgi:hypothetical protein
MMSRTRRWCARSALLALLSVSPAFAAEPEKPSDPTPEARQQMAAVHQKMAECLRSDRPIAECRAEMMRSCHEMMGERGCPMMGSTGGGMGPGMMGGRMMQGGPAPEAPKK